MIPTISNNANDISATPALFAGLLAVLAQNNPAVQECLLNQESNNHFLAHCLQTLVNDNASETYKVKCVGAVSSIVRGYAPALKYLSQQNGVETLKQCFDAGLQKKEDKVVERLAIAVANVALSFEGIPVVEKTQVADLLNHIHDTLIELNESDSDYHSSALEYIQSNNDIMKHIDNK
uniref:Uncharacterized protein n=1 Tax=Ditylenchus dipsaci TaxID=166011 RepID=A0A915DUL5_9BILA